MRLDKVLFDGDVSIDGGRIQELGRGAGDGVVALGLWKVIRKGGSGLVEV